MSRRILFSMPFPLIVVEFANVLLRFGVLYPVLWDLPDLLLLCKSRERIRVSVTTPKQCINNDEALYLTHLAICPLPRTRNLFAALLFVLRVLLAIPLVTIIPPNKVFCERKAVADELMIVVMFRDMRAHIFAGK